MSEINDKEIFAKHTFDAYEQDGRTKGSAFFRHRGASIRIKDLKKVNKIFGKSVDKLVQLNDDLAHMALLAGVRLQAVQGGFLPLTRKDRHAGHYLCQCGSCGYWGTSRILLKIKNGEHCPICHSIKISKFDVEAEINRLNKMNNSF